MSKTTDLPKWFDGKKVDEAAFCRDFLTGYPMICVSGSFFIKDGRVCDENLLRRKIYNAVSPYIKTGLAKKLDGLLELLRVEAYTPDLPVKEDCIHVANGTYRLDGGFTKDKEFCRNRLPVAYHPDAPKPVRWLSFLNELLIPEDILTQDFAALFRDQQVIFDPDTDLLFVYVETRLVTDDPTGL